MIMCRTVLFSVLILVVCAAGAKNKPAAGKVPPRGTIAASGKQTYLQYCASSTVSMLGAMDRLRSCSRHRRRI